MWWDGKRNVRVGFVRWENISGLGAGCRVKCLGRIQAVRPAGLPWSCTTDTTDTTDTMSQCQRETCVVQSTAYHISTGQNSQTQKYDSDKTLYCWQWLSNNNFLDFGNHRKALILNETRIKLDICFYFYNYKAGFTAVVLYIYILMENM